MGMGFGVRNMVGSKDTGRKAARSQLERARPALGSPFVWQPEEQDC